jgi:hypothetical protein
MFKKEQWMIVFLFTSILLASLSCSMPSWLGASPSGLQLEETIQAMQMATERHQNQNTSNIAGQWTIEECNAIQDVTITVKRFEEYQVDEGHVECDYSHEILNVSQIPIRIIYYKHFYYGGLEPPNDYEFGWNKVAPRQPSETWILSSFLSDCSKCTPTRYESIHFSIAIVYDNPQCEWITAGDGIHFDILQIAEEQPLLAPCTTISPITYSEAVPDISIGLRR